jgi:glycosyltransferase involved in cell wall biosynthesis
VTALRTCAVVPTFDNPRTVRAAVEALRVHLRDVIVVDDGSGAEGRAACAEIAAAGLATLERRAVNGGKGAAVKTGFAAAQARGFTHVLQVDADGQHDLGCIPNFLSASAERPEALILGYPLFDGSAPRSRRIARRFTAFWVTLELGRPDQVVDAMVGFRIYPLQAALAAGARGDHMDFDVEIAVRMARAGTPVVNLPVGVRYLAPREGGVSHFQPLRDNLRFFGVHSRLCTGGAFGWARRALGVDRRWNS